MACVQEFRTRKRFFTLSDSGGVDPALGADTANDRECSKPIGFGDIVTMVFGQGRLGVAIYTRGSELRLVIDGKQFDMFQPELRVVRVSLFPFVKKFTIWRGPEILLSFRYLCTDLRDDPHTGTRDILKFVAELSESREHRYRFFFVWREVQLGRDATSADARARIEEAVKQACQS